MPGYITLDQLRSAADAIIRPASVDTTPDPWYLEALSNALTAGQGFIRRALAVRGYSGAVQAAWVDGPELELALGLFFVSVYARSDLQPEQLALLETYDRRDELADIPVTDAAGKLLQPDAF